MSSSTRIVEVDTFLHKYTVRLSLPTPNFTPSKPIIVFIHGLLVDSVVWDKTMTSLAAEGFQCVAPDLPLGCHTSPVKNREDLTFENIAKSVEELLSSLGVKEYVIVGNDTGGVIVQGLMRREIEGSEHQRKIKGLVMTPCECLDNFMPHVFMPLVKIVRTLPGTFLIAVLAAVFTNSYLVRLPMALSWLVKHISNQGAILEQLASRACTTVEIKRDVKHILLDVDSSYTLAAAKVLHKFKRPSTVVLAPEDTTVLPSSYMKQFADVLRRPSGASEQAEAYDRVKTVEVRDSYGLVQLDQPERLAEIIATHMKEQEAL
ncbi:hypothetical protein HK405_013623 [Cladochytrium tenue]|nr:hypothetical protein HK405_013623 [Cladochytrium tenue]